MKNSITLAAPSGVSPFDSIRRVEEGTEFWLARELMPVLGYSKWENFGAKEHGMIHKSGNRVTSTVCRALMSCNISGLDSSLHFTHFPPVGTRQTSTPEDWKLSRHACYLIGMCGDVTKPEISAAQSYFATKTREAEINDRLNPANAIDKLIEGLQDLKLLLGGKEQIDHIEQRLDHQEAEIGRIFQPDGQYFSIRGWAKQRKIKVNVEQAKAYGHVASRLSKKLGIPTDKLPDPRYGKVNAYHESVLVQIF